MIKKNISLILACIFFLLLFNGCTNDDKNDNKLTVAVTIVPQEAFVKAVCGDMVNVITIVPSGSSPDNYEPTTKQLSEFSNAKVYFTIGVQVEQAKVIPKAVDTTVVKLEEEVSSYYSDLTFEGAERDPHIWLSPKRAAVMVKIISEEMIKIDSENKDTYESNTRSYLEKLTQLDDYIKNLYKERENKNNVFLTFHPAYNYFAKDYGLSMYALEQEGREATAQDLQEMIDFANSHNIKTIFSQAESASRQPTAFAEEVGGKVVILDPLSGDYLENMKHMAEQIAEALV